MGSSRSFASTPSDKFALFRLGFPHPSVRKTLTEPLTVTRRIIMQKARSHPVITDMGLLQLVGVWFQVQYPPLTGVLPTFQSPYYALSVTKECLALRDGPR
jgi:hypothetical protein